MIISIQRSGSSSVTQENILYSGHDWPATSFEGGCLVTSCHVTTLLQGPGGLVLDVRVIANQVAESWW